MWYKSRLLSVLHGLFHLQSAVRAKMRFLSRPQRLWKRSSITCSAVLAVQALAGTAIAQPAPEPAQAPLINEGAPNKEPAPAAATPTEVERESWRKTILKTPRPTAGCFTATYPDKQWREVPCKTPSNKLYPPKHGGTTRSEIVGGAGPDFSAVVSGHITEAEGSFDPGTVVSSECGVPCPNQVCPTNPTCTGAPANSYSLQLNSKPFKTNTCAGSPGGVNGGCLGWEQFVYPSSGGGSIQYWLETYGPAGTLCPTPRSANCQPGVAPTDGWCPFSFSPTGPVYCVVNAINATTAPAAPITSLSTLKLTGAAAGVAGAANDSITVSVGGTPYTASGNNYFPDLGSQWQEAEFNVFGDGNGDQAVFNSGATIDMRTGVASGTTSGPSCDLQGFTGESNNLTLVNTPPAAVKGTLPALLFSESNPAPAGAAATCADATSVGDTHLATFNGLFYDFQASGDFLLAQVDPDFVVQTRQVSGAPTWPNADVNNAVATRMGKTQVAICLAPARLAVDGKINDLGDGQSLSLPDGVDVKRKGNVYLITGESGDSVRAEVNASWINVSVGLGRWPAKVRGLIANANGNVNEIETRDGTALTNPFPFADLYHRYADSWRVPSNESLLRVCGDREIESGIPTTTFYANDLDPKLYERARAVCVAAGVKVGPLLDACTLDVTVIGSDTAAQVFVGAPAPIAVGGIVNTPDNSWKWLMWLVLALVIAFLLGMLFLILRKTP